MRGPSSQGSRKWVGPPNPRSARALKSQSPSGSGSLRQRLRERRKGSRGEGKKKKPGRAASRDGCAGRWLLPPQDGVPAAVGEGSLSRPRRKEGSGPALAALLLPLLQRAAVAGMCVARGNRAVPLGGCAPGRGVGGCSSQPLRLAGSSAGRGGETVGLAA